MLKDQNKSAFLLRIHSDLYRQLAKLSTSRKKSMNLLCTELLEKALMDGKSDDAKWIEEFKKVYEPHGLIAILLFGSRARGDAKEDSDFDLLLVFNSHQKITRSLYRLMDEETPYSIHCVAMPENPDSYSSFWFEIALDGKILWKKNPQIDLLLKSIKNEICSGSHIRKTTNGHPYWVKINAK